MMRIVKLIVIGSVVTGIVLGLTSVVTSKYLSGPENVWWRFVILSLEVALLWFYAWMPLFRKEERREKAAEQEGRKAWK